MLARTAFAASLVLSLFRAGGHEWQVRGREGNDEGALLPDQAKLYRRDQPLQVVVTRFPSSPAVDEALFHLIEAS
jgi:hypothetical protein